MLLGVVSVNECEVLLRYFREVAPKHRGNVVYLRPGKVLRALGIREASTRLYISLWNLLQELSTVGLARVEERPSYTVFIVELRRVPDIVRYLEERVGRGTTVMSLR